MAESPRNKKRETFRQQLSQTWDDAQIHRPPEKPAGPWENERVVEVNPQKAPLPSPEPEFLIPSEASVAPPKAKNPVFELVWKGVRRDGFTHPEEGNFVMLPREFAALLALENKSVVQVVLYVICETVGWVDPQGRYGRREWVRLGQRHFNMICGSSSQGFNGVKEALQGGYIIRRPKGNSYEYSLRWKDKRPQ